MIRKPLILPEPMLRMHGPNRTEIARQMLLAEDAEAAFPASLRFIFLCFTNRCGSAYLGDLLHSTGRIGIPGETLNAGSVLEYARDHDLRSFAECFASIVERDRQDDIYIVKVAPEQIVLLVQSGILDRIIERSDFLFLNRADKLGQAISRVIAEQNNRWAWDSPIGLPDDELVYSFERITQNIDDVTLLNLCFERFFAINGIAAISIEYERLVSAPVREISDIGERLQLPELSADLDKLHYRRQANDINHAWRSRFLLETRESAESSSITNTAPEETGTPTVMTDIVVHIRNVGDVRGECGRWLGTTKSGLWIEGFSITPGPGMESEDIEYHGIQDFGRVSAWTSGGQFCGTRGMILPLRGFCVRLRDSATALYECEYSARFLDGSTVGPVAGGQVCRSPSLAPLEALQIVLRPL